MSYRYTADMIYSDHHQIQSRSNDLGKLILHTIIMLEYHRGHFHGFIRDNETGQIVHRCQKKAMQLN